ncbi:hypothetical protein IQ268_16810 [Oculatella sp. LEGE 06141]|uniref:hypothetical protein n=1 Tax=Oculatella sp. LEGE 06141 TaxID=1828648 RepID=UPI00187E868F|nr:hypothetical protein [Oculatella sp. LEGE 06141]MBE9180226.1 hypothetical protein [Oculatella sp. LEGE 06141]
MLAHQSDAERIQRLYAEFALRFQKAFGDFLEASINADQKIERDEEHKSDQPPALESLPDDIKIKVKDGANERIVYGTSSKGVFVDEVSGNPGLIDALNVRLQQPVSSDVDRQDYGSKHAKILITAPDKSELFRQEADGNITVNEIQFPPPERAQTVQPIVTEPSSVASITDPVSKEEIDDGWNVWERLIEDSTAPVNLDATASAWREQPSFVEIYSSVIPKDKQTGVSAITQALQDVPETETVAKLRLATAQMEKGLESQQTAPPSPEKAVLEHLVEQRMQTAQDPGGWAIFSKIGKGLEALQNWWEQRNAAATISKFANTIDLPPGESYESADYTLSRARDDGSFTLSDREGNAVLSFNRLLGVPIIDSEKTNLDAGHLYQINRLAAELKQQQTPSGAFLDRDVDRTAMSAQVNQAIQTLRSYADAQPNKTASFTGGPKDFSWQVDPQGVVKVGIPKDGKLQALIHANGGSVQISPDLDRKLISSLTNRLAIVRNVAQSQSVQQEPSHQKVVPLNSGGRVGGNVPTRKATANMEL